MYWNQVYVVDKKRTKQQKYRPYRATKSWYWLPEMWISQSTARRRADKWWYVANLCSDLKDFSRTVCTSRKSTTMKSTMKSTCKIHIEIDQKRKSPHKKWKISRWFMSTSGHWAKGGLKRKAKKPLRRNMSELACASNWCCAKKLAVWPSLWRKNEQHSVLVKTATGGFYLFVLKNGHVAPMSQREIDRNGNFEVLKWELLPRLCVACAWTEAVDYVEELKLW